MKRFLVLLLSLTVLALWGCGMKPAQAEDEEFYLEYRGCRFSVNEEFEPVHEKLGKEDSLFEALSCALAGMDRTYTYPELEIVTGERDGREYIMSLRILTPELSTPEGLTIGSTVSELKKACGEDYTELLNQYSYKRGDTELCLIFEEEKAVAVTIYAAEAGK